ncbi:MAG: hypothetical protein OEY49_12720 [Candidatus Heimdallarchaeota archaeon]|nr:hypothetical protein [Candidatus Heimdallarchaeota archaeon]
MVIPLDRFILMTDGGLTVYNKSFQNKKYDAFLFGSFIGAILSFTNDLGEKLTSLSLQSLTLTFKKLNNFIIVVGYQEDLVTEQAITHLFNEFEQSEFLKEKALEAEFGAVEITNEFEESVNIILQSIFNNYENIDSLISINSSENQIRTKEQKEIMQIINKLFNSDVQIRDLALTLIGKEISSQEAISKSIATDMVIELISMTNIEPKFKKKLNELLIQMKNRTLRAAKKTQRALF